MRQLKAIDSRFDVWDWGDRQELLETEAESGTYPFEEIDKNLVQAIERNASAVDREPPDPFYGYWMSIGTKTGIFFTARECWNQGRAFFHALHEHRGILAQPRI